ncbi:MAG TPA: hypothetical protein VKU39_15140 [Streptosporangiaceae bacterium]|nr:hypothetical protein [Streptosporangiaceae bacterium]
MRAAALDVTTYRAAVHDLLAYLERPGIADPVAIIAERLVLPEFAQVLTAAQGGLKIAGNQILHDVRKFGANSAHAKESLPQLVGICLLAQIDAAWWGATPEYQSDLDVTQSADLVDVDSDAVGFRFRRQTDAPARRLLRAAERRLLPGRTPDPVGLRFARTRPEVVRLLNELSAEFGRFAPAGTPPLWVTSLARSMQHQLRLRSLGYAAMLPSSHCTGYGVDIVMSWYRRYGAAGVLHQMLLERCEAGQVNVIRGAQTWHVCLSPRGAAEMGG